MIAVVAADEQVLPGGNVSKVVRVGDTVRRPAGPWTPRVQELLRHVRSRGFSLAPEPLGLDDQGREVLRYIDGDTVGDGHPWPPWAWEDCLLTEAVSALAHYHQAVADYRPGGEIISRIGRSTLRPGDIICHNDLAPYNVVTRAGRLVGIIDWDVIVAAPPSWDLAFMAWHWTPLHHDALARSSGWSTSQDIGRRLSLICETYGLDDRSGFIDLISERVDASRQGILGLAAQGDPAFIRLRDEGHAADMAMTLDFIDRQRPTLEDAID